MRNLFTNLIVHGSIMALLVSQAAFSAEKVIGQIAQIDSSYWDVFLRSQAGKHKSAKGTPIHEHDVLQTIVNQHVNIMMDDGTELYLGPSSRLTFENWTERDHRHRLRRSILLTTGILRAKVRKIYSQEEPFLVETTGAVIAVRGTEFVVETGTGGRLETARRLTPQETIVRRSEIELHTLEGEVQFSKSEDDLLKPETRVAVLAGQTSLIRYGMDAPQTPHEFDVTKFQRYVAKALPKLDTRVVRNTTNTERAEVAAHVAQPVHEASRSIASEPTDKPKSSAPASRRKQFLWGLTVEQMMARRERAERQRLPTDRIHDAFRGGDRSPASSWKENKKETKK